MRLPTTHKSADPMVANLARVNSWLGTNPDPDRDNR